MMGGMDWQYYKLSRRGGYFYVRVDEDQEIAETREENDTEWERQDAYFGEVVLNGQGWPCGEAEALAALPA